MSTLPNGPIVLYYNGFPWPTESSTTIAERPELDLSGRTAKYVVYDITIRATLGQATQPGTTDAVMADLRQRLMAVGGELHVEGTGYGPLICNIPPAGPSVGTASLARDVKWGPIPRSFKWVPKGQLACEIEWRCEVALSPCAAAGGVWPPPLEYVYSVVYNVDRSGYTRRTIRGSVSVPQTRANVDSTALTDSGDRLREQVTPALLPGFRRIPGVFDLSLDKCKLSFAFVDEEAGPNYPPPGVVEVSMEHRVSTGPKSPLGTGQWGGVLRGTYEVARGLDRSTPYAFFLRVFRQKYLAANANPWTNKEGVLQQYVAIQSLEMSEPQIYGRQCAQFTLRYCFFANLSTVALASGLWLPAPNSDWLAWSGSLTGPRGPMTSRGNAGLTFATNSETIIDPCHQATSPGGPDAPPSDLPPDPTEPDPDAPPENDLPDPEASWLLYRSTIRVERVDSTVVLKPLPPPPIQTPPPSPGLQGGVIGGGGIPDLLEGGVISTGAVPAPGVGAAAGLIAPLPDPPQPPLIPTVIAQTRTPPTYYAYLEGRAVRGGYPITPPALLVVGGCPVVPANREGDGSSQEVASNWFGLDIYAATWRLRYLIVGIPTGEIPVMDTPFLGGS